MLDAVIAIVAIGVAVLAIIAAVSCLVDEKKHKEDLRKAARASDDEDPRLF